VPKFVHGNDSFFSGLCFQEEHLLYLPHYVQRAVVACNYYGHPSTELQKSTKINNSFRDCLSKKYTFDINLPL
jgi:hypothetical protein